MAATKTVNIDYFRYKHLLKTRQTANGVTEIFDPVRRKFLVLQPEELVRQLTLLYLLDRGFSIKKMRTEIGITINGLQKRCDILVFDKNLQPFLLVECKAANVDIDEAVFQQIARYNLVLNVPFLMVTNGKTTYFCARTEGGWDFIENLHLPKN